MVMGKNVMTQQCPCLRSWKLPTFRGTMPKYGRMGAVDTHSEDSACPRRSPGGSSQTSQQLLIETFLFGGPSVNRGLERGWKLCLPLLMLALLSCLPVVPKQGILVPAALYDAEVSQKEASVVLSDSEIVQKGSNVARVSPSNRALQMGQEGFPFSLSGSDGRAEEQRVKRRRNYVDSSTVTRTRDEEEDQEKQVDLDTYRSPTEVISDLTKIPGSLLRQESPKASADDVVHGTTVSHADVADAVPMSARALSHTSPLKASRATAATLQQTPLAWFIQPTSTETPVTSLRRPQLSLESEASLAPAPQESTSSFGFSLRDALRFPVSLLSPLHIAFAPKALPSLDTSTTPSGVEAPPNRHSALEDTQQDSEAEIERAAQLLRDSLRWSNTFAEDIQKRILELTGQKSSQTHMNKELLGLVGNIRRTFAGKKDPEREAEESTGDAPGSGSDQARRNKKPLPPFDKQTRKHMSYVREWFTVSVGATMNGMRDQDEDNFPNSRMFSLFDGHSGQEAARRCSANASRIFGQLSELSPAALKQACLDLDERIRNYPGPRLKSGSTGVIAIVGAVELGSGTVFNVHMANVGDSRAFLLHMNDDTYEILTRDHKPNQALKRVASKTPDEQQVTAVPGTSTATARPGDYLLLGCDGVFEGEGMSWDFVARLLKESIVFFGGDTAATVNHLIDIAFALGSRDNISILLIKFTTKKLTPLVKRFQIEVDGTARELPVEILPGDNVSTSAAGVYQGEQSLLVTLFS